MDIMLSFILHLLFVIFLLFGQYMDLDLQYD